MHQNSTESRPDIATALSELSAYRSRSAGTATLLDHGQPTLEQQANQSISETPDIVSPPYPEPSPGNPANFRSSRFWNLPPLPGGIPLPKEEPHDNAAEMNAITRGVVTHDTSTLLGAYEAAQLLAAGIEPLPHRAKPSGPERTLWRKMSDGLWELVKCGRTEKAWRYLTVIPILFYFSGGGTGVEQSIRHLAVPLFTFAVFYLSPFVATLAFLCFAVVPALITAFALATLMWVVDVGGVDYYESTSHRYWDLVVLFVAFLWAATLRVSPFRQLLSPAYFGVTYALMHCVVRGSVLLRGGSTVKAPWSEDLNILDVLSQAKSIMSSIVWGVWMAAAPQIQSAIDSDRNSTVWLSSSLAETAGWLKPAVGKPVVYRIADDHSEVSFYMPGGFYLVRMMWSGGEGLGWFTAGLEVGLLLLLVYGLTTLLPPPRTYIDRVRAGGVLAAERLVNEALDLGKRLEPDPATGRTEAMNNLEEETDIGFRYVLEHHRRSIARRRDTELSTATRRMLAEIRLRARYSLTSDTLTILQQNMVHALHECWCFSPLGVNPAVTQPFVFKSMQSVATSLFLVAQFLKLIEVTYPEKKGETGFLGGISIDNTPLNQLIPIWIQNSVNLLEAVSVVAGSRSFLVKDSAGSRKLESAREVLRLATAVMKDSEFSMKVAEEKLAEAVKNSELKTGQVQRSGCRKLAASIWFNFFRRAYVKEQLKLAGECEAYLNSLEERNWKGLGRSISGLLMPLRVYLSGAGYMFVQSVRALKDNKSHRHVANPSPFLIARELAYGRPYIQKPPNRGRIRRYKTVELAIHGQNINLRQSTFRTSGEAPSPSGFRALERMPSSEYAPGTNFVEIYYEGDEHHLFQFTDLWHVMRFAVGATVLTTVAVIFETERKREYFSTSSVEEVRSDWRAAVSPWGGVAFLTTLSLTLQGTVTRGILNIVAIAIGTLMGYICLQVPTEYGWFYTLWISVTGALLLWFSPKSRASWTSRHPTLAPIAAMTMVQQTFIIMEGYYKFDGTRELCINWGVSNLCAVLLGMAVSSLVVPTRANRSIRQNLADALFSAAESFVACVEIAFSDGNDNLESRHHAQIFRQEWEGYHDFQKLNGRYHLKSLHMLQEDAFIHARVPFSLFEVEANMDIISNGAGRLLDYAAACKVQLNDIRRLTAREVRPPDLTEIDLERKFKDCMIQVSERIVNTHALIQTAVDSVGRWRWFGQKNSLETLTRQQYLHILELESRQSAKQLIALGEVICQTAAASESRLLEIQNRGYPPEERLGSYDSNTSGTPSPVFLSEPPPILPPPSDRRSVTWAFALLHLAELNYIGASAAHLFQVGPELTSNLPEPEAEPAPNGGSPQSA